MKRYCWRESRAKIVAIVKTKMQLVLGKKHLGNERIYRKRMFAKSRIEIEILENLRKPLTRKSTRKRIDIDFERVSFICALARLTKIENVWFCSGGFSYAIQEKFTAWQVNSTLNFTWKTDITLIVLQFVRCRFLAWNLTWNSLVTQWIFLYCIIISYCITMISRRNFRRN